MFKHYPQRQERLTVEFAQSEYRGLTERIPSAEQSDSPNGWLKLFADWNALKAYVSGEESRIHYALSKDVNDAAVEEAERYFREEVKPVAEMGNSQLVHALLGSRHKGAIADRFGRQLIRVLETAVEPLAPINSELRVKEGELVTRYDKIIAQGEVEVQGKTVTLSVARSLTSSSDPAVRREAFQNYRQWFLNQRDELAGIFSELVALRHQMGQNLGHANYIPLGYKGMGRTDYGTEEARRFRDSVKQYAVPLQKRLYERQAQELGVDSLRPWDVEYDPALTLPTGVVPVDGQLDQAQRVFDLVSPRLGAHFKRMRDEGLIDLENRKGKRAGAFCTSFSDEGRVAIFCNSTGDEDDVRTLVHEMGHAFQGWESQTIEAVDLQWPTSDACEIHSMGMEYLAMPHMTEFFKPEYAEKFRRHRWKQAIELLCYICVVDEFQHWLYENPNRSPNDRDQAWSRIWDTYKVGIDFTGVESYKVARWYAQGHIFGTPFYYIDYAIAETGAMQLALLNAQNPQKAVDAYIRLCEVGGTKSVLEIFQDAHLRSPFDPSLMRDLMNHAAQELGLAVSGAAG